MHKYRMRSKYNTGGPKSTRKRKFSHRHTSKSLRLKFKQAKEVLEKMVDGGIYRIDEAGNYRLTEEAKKDRRY